MTQDAKNAAKVISQKVPHFTPKVGIILGTGLGGLTDIIENATVIPYQDLPGFPICTIAGHGGQLILGHLEGVPVACLQGRAHFYEGATRNNMQTIVRTLKLLGIETLIITNSAGSLRQEVGPGNLVLIRDHINFQFTNPLVGPNDDEFGPRFPAMEDAYDPKLRLKAQEIAKDLNIPLSEGVYLGVLGPSFETPAEIKAFRCLGADLVGMSTVSEVILARHCGLRVLAISVATNYAADLSKHALSHEETLSTAAEALDKLKMLIRAFLKQRD